MSINLRSKVLIEYFGVDVLSEENLDNIMSITIYNNEKIDSSETRLFEEDLFTILKTIPILNELELYGFDNLDIDKLLKESPSEKNGFTGSTEHFENLRNNKLDISEKTKESLVFDDGQVVTEYDLYEKLKICKAFNIDNVIDVDDLEVALKYIDIFEIRVQIRSASDLEKINNLTNGGNVKLEVDFANLENIEGLQNDSSKTINLSINSMSELSVEKIELLQTQYNLNEIYMGSEYKSNNDRDMSANAEWYDIDTYKKLREEIDNIVQGLEGKPDIEKFIAIYKRLGNKISYDHENMDRIYGEDGSIHLGGYKPAHNLEGGLLNNTCVCEGYAKILKQALSCVDIESKYIVGQGQSEQHAWNQIKIDGKWYNTDLTWDTERIQENRTLDYCLQSDDEFINHTVDEYVSAEKCDESFDRNTINRYMDMPFDFDIEIKKYSPYEIINLTSELNSISNAGTRISINRDFDTGEYSIMIGNITKDGSVRWANNEIAISSENVVDFIRKYSEKYTIEEKETSGVVDFISSTEGVGLVVDEQLKELIERQGISAEELLSPKIIQNEPIISESIETSIDSTTANEKTVDSIQGENRISSSTNLIEYKPNILNKFFTAVRERFTQIKDKILKKDSNERTIINTEPTMELNVTNPKEKLPSWDLRNWTQEELVACSQKSKQTTRDNNLDLENDNEISL